MSLDQTTIVQGEPLLLRWSVSNGTRSPVALELGADTHSWYSIEVRGPHGRLIPAQPAPGGEWHNRNSMPMWVLAPGAERSEAHTFVMPLGAIRRGHYTVTVRTKLKRQLGYDARNRVTYEEAKSDPITLPLEVLPDTGNALTQVAERYAERAKKAFLGTDGVPLIEALLAMPAPRAFPVWRGLILARDNWDNGNRVGLGSLNRKLILDRMAVLASAKAENTVAAVWNDAQQPDDVRVAAENALIAMWWKADASVKRQIETDYIERRGAMFNTQMEPGPPDD
jgi:hypothetical protein